MKLRILAVIALLAVCVLVILGYSNTTEPITVTDYKLNTYVTITIYDSKDTSLLSDCIALCDRYELIFSRTNPESELYQLNHGLLPTSKDGYYTVSEELFSIIET